MTKPYLINLKGEAFASNLAPTVLQHKSAGIQFIDVIPNFLVTCPVHIPPLRFHYSC